MNQQIKVTYLKRLINSKEYTIRRADEMNNRVQYWKESSRRANTQRCRDFCKTMVDMYLKRYMYYCKSN